MIYYLSVVTIFQNETRFLKEWLEYHIMIGVEHFYLLDNNSTDNPLEILKPYIEKNMVSYLLWTEEFTTTENNARDQGLMAARVTSKWLAVIDLDEFLVPKCTDDLRLWLKNYEAYSAVVINWQMFGTSGIKIIPENKLMIEVLIKKADENHSNHTHIKSIVQPEHTYMLDNPHYGIYPYGFAVNPDKNRIDGPWGEICINDIQINHYCHHDLKFLKEQKLERLNKYRAETMENLIHVDNTYSCVIDKSILRFTNQLKINMGII
jgi:glycosyltransferase involved in cell wall biosynthesis